MLGQGLRWQPLSLPRGSEEETQEVEISYFPLGSGQHQRLLTPPDMSSSLIHAGEGARKPKCARCRNHGVISWLKVFSCKTRILMNFSQLCVCRGTSGVASSGTVTALSATSYKSGRGSWRHRFLTCGILIYVNSDKEGTGRPQKI